MRCQSERPLLPHLVIRMLHVRLSLLNTLSQRLRTPRTPRRHQATRTRLNLSWAIRSLILGCKVILNSGMSRAGSYILSGALGHGILRAEPRQAGSSIKPRSESTLSEASRSDPAPENKPESSSRPKPRSRIDDLLTNNQVLSDFIRRPRHKILLAHGLYGFDVRPRFILILN